MIQILPRLMLFAIFGCTPLWGADELTPEQRKARATWDAAVAAMVRGPDTVPLRDQATLDRARRLRASCPRRRSRALMRMMGNTDRQTASSAWFIRCRRMTGTSWRSTTRTPATSRTTRRRTGMPDELLQSLKDGTEAGNEEREKMGIGPIKVTRWIEPPAYDAASHRLVWSAEAVLKVGKDPDPTINYNTYVLGREGYISANLITVAVDGGRRPAAGRAAAPGGDLQREEALHGLRFLHRQGGRLRPHRAGGRPGREEARTARRDHRPSS